MHETWTAHSTQNVPILLQKMSEGGKYKNIQT